MLFYVPGRTTDMSEGAADVYGFELHLKTQTFYLVGKKFEGKCCTDKSCSGWQQFVSDERCE